MIVRPLFLRASPLPSPEGKGELNDDNDYDDDYNYDNDYDDDYKCKHSINYR